MEEKRIHADRRLKLCVGKECPFRDNCLRRIALPTHPFNSFFHKIPYNAEKRKCKYFIDINN